MQEEKGNIALIIIIILLVLGLLVAVFLVGQKTNLFPKAYSPSPSIQPLESIDKEKYQNPFESQSSSDSTYSNPFDESPQNPFDN